MRDTRGSVEAVQGKETSRMTGTSGALTGQTGMRGEIQALRAVAVLAVVIFHIWPTALPGGYVGVDIFFVISGYLITSHLLREIERNGNIRLTEFWARRVRRLLPAAFVVLGASLVATLVVLSWSQWQQGLREIAASALYVQNWLLASDSVDYLAAENSPTLVQHYWSLSVEEQFYIVWPVLILAALSIARRSRAACAARRRAIVVALLIVFVASLVASVIWTGVSPASAYFVTVTRAWEFAAGGLLAFAPGWLKAPNDSRAGVAVHLVVSWCGLALIGYAVLSYDEGTPFPGYTALVPVVGTLAVIWARESRSTWSPTWVGRAGPVQWVGDVSYSVYLWHWPLVVLYPVVEGSEPGVKGGVAIFAATLLLGWLSKRYVEDPFRTGVWWTPRWRSYGFAAVGMTAIIAIVAVSNVVIDKRIAAAAAGRTPYVTLQELQADVADTLAAGSWEIPDQLGGRAAQPAEWVIDHCIDVQAEKTRQRCVYGDPDAEQTMVVIGDSFATHFLPRLRAAFGEAYTIRPLTLSQCPIVDVPVKRNGESGEFTECVAHNAKNLDLLREISPDVLIISDATPTTFRRMLGGLTGSEREAAYLDGAKRAYDELASLGLERVVVLETAPDANCVPRNSLSSPRDCTADQQTEQTLRLQKGKLQAAEDAGFETLDTTSWLCSTDGVCPILLGNTLTRADRAHLSNTFSALLGPVLAQEMSLPSPEQQAAGK